MSSVSSKPVIISGAGLAGSLLAVSLAQRGFHVEVFERRPDMRKQNVDRGRSINLAMSVRGLTALKEVGIEDEVRKLAIPMRGRLMHSPTGTLSYHPYSHDPSKDTLFSIDRGLLNQQLITLAESKSTVNFHFNQKCTGFDSRTGVVTFVDEVGKSVTIEGQTIFGSDGAFSSIRSSMLKTDRFEYSQSFIEHGYKELHIPPGPGGVHQLEREALHIWPRGSFMMIALPNIDGSFTCTLFFPFEGEESFQTLSSKEKVDEFFTKYFPDAKALMPSLLEDFFQNPTSSLVTIRCYPWASPNGRSLLIGDAAHAIVPFYGQGMNAAFEDVYILGKYIDGELPHGAKKEAFWDNIFSRYQKIRKPDADAIAGMALENFIEMRDKVADPDFLFEKQVEHLLEEKFPDRYISRYEMISFGTRPYSEALKIGKINTVILAELTKDANRDINKIDLNLADKLIKERLSL
eukprot:TRINITY_DN3642_c0_g2_i1.p1 TRINITY_DN3642_c0_g2~~TRINITY_DN3642_c0_g2_i1.p1  ORF type:complete len:511 (-),score=92.17 TRINITY_DN3642_c0_g2_i1:58-1443(-)